MALVLFPFFLLDGSFGGRWHYDELNPSTYRWFETLAYPVLFLAPPAVAIWFGRRIGSPWQAFVAALLPFFLGALYLWLYLFFHHYPHWKFGFDLYLPRRFYPCKECVVVVGVAVALMAAGCSLSRQPQCRWHGLATAACGMALWLGMMIPAVVDYVTYWQDGRTGSIWWHGSNQPF